MPRRSNKLSEEEGDRICAQVLMVVRAVGDVMTVQLVEAGPDPVEAAPEAATAIDLHQRRRNAAAASYHSGH